MIEVTNDIKAKYPTAFSKAYAEKKIRAVRLRPLLWYCARTTPNHGEYLVRFHVVPAINGGEQVKVECRSIDGDRCKGCWQDRMCIHIAKVLLRGIAHGRRTSKRKQVAA